MKGYPIPAHTDILEGTIRVSDLGCVQYTEKEDGQELAAELLTEKAAAFTGGELTGVIPILLEKESKMAPEHYCILVNGQQVCIKAGERKGFLYGAARFAQFLLEEQIPCCKIEDGPFQQMRGFHMGLPPREEIDFYKRLIRELLVPMGYNTLFLQITAGMRLQRHPEINAAWMEACRKSASGEWPHLHHEDMIAGGQVLEQEEVAELAAYAREYGLEVIPEIQSLGHVQYMTLAHPELAEIGEEEEADVLVDERVADQPAANFYKDSYCPSNENSYRLLFDIMDEILEVMQPARYVHMGHDEVYHIGLCPACRKKSPAELYAQDVRKIHDYLQKKGLRMMIWSDMIQPDSGYATTGALDMLPRDVVMLDFIWYFHMEEDLEDHLLQKGYPVAVGNLYSSHYPRYEARIRKANMLGGEVSTWCRPDEYVLGREGKLYDLLYTADMLWSERYDSAQRDSCNRMIWDLLPWIRSGLHGQGLYPSLKKGAKETALSLQTGSSTDRCCQLQADFADKGFVQVCRIDSENPAVCSGEDTAWESLIFYHATLSDEGRVPFGELKKSGRYVIEFADGSREKVTVEYGGNIGCIDMRYAEPMPDITYRHAGYVSTYFTDPVEAVKNDGSVQTLYRYEWLNAAQKKVRRILCEAENGSVILLAGVRGIRTNFGGEGICKKMVY